jgi:hypothetical protein
MLFESMNSNFLKIIITHFLKALATLLKSFPKKLGKDINEILAQVWTCLVQSSQVYVGKIVNSNSYVENVTASSGNDSLDLEGI